MVRLASCLGSVVFFALSVSVQGGEPAAKAKAKTAVDKYGDPLPEQALLRLGTSRFKHRGTIRSAAFSPDGALLATGGGSTEHHIHLHDVKAGQVRAVARGCSHDVMALAFAANGKAFMSIDGGTFRLWEVATAQERLVITTPWPMIHAHAWSPEARLVALAFSDRIHKPPDPKDGKVSAQMIIDTHVRVYSLTTGQEIAAWRGKGGFVSGLALAPDGQTLLFAEGQFLRVLDPRTAKETRKLPMPFLSSLQYLPDGKSVLFIDDRRHLVHWDPRADKELKKFPVPAEFAGEWHRYSPDGRWLAIFKRAIGANRNKTTEIHIIDTSTGQATQTLNMGQEGLIYGMAFAPDQRTFVATGWRQQHPYMWDMKTGQRLDAVEGHGTRLNAIHFSSDGNLLFTGSDDQTIGIWDARSGMLRQRVNAGYDFYSVALSADDKYLASGGTYGRVCLWEAAGGKPLHQWQSLKGSVVHVAFSPDSKVLATCATDNFICLWSVPKGELIKTLKGHTAPVRKVAFSADGQHLVSAGRDKTIRVWNVANGQTITVFKEHTLDIAAVQFAPVGSLVASGDAQQVVLWEAKSGQVVRTLQGPFSKILGLAFTPDGKYVATSNGGDSSHGPNFGPEGQDGLFAINLFAVSTGQLVHRWQGHRGYVGVLAFSHDGKRLASGSNDTTALVWTVPDEKRLKKAAEPRRESRLPANGAGETFQETLYCSFQDSETPPASKKPKNPEPLHMIRPGGGVRSAALSPDGKLLATGGGSGKIELWDTDRGVVTKKLDGHEGDISDLLFTPDGQKLYSAASKLAGTGDQSVRLWDIAGGKELRRFDDFGRTIHAISLAPDGKSLAVAFDGEVCLRDTLSGKELWKVQKENRLGHPVQVRFSPRGDLLAISGGTFDFLLVQSDSGKTVQSFPVRVPYNHVFKPIFTPGTSLLVIPQAHPTRADWGLEAWDLAGGQIMLRFSNPWTRVEENRPRVDLIVAAAVAPDGRLLAGGSHNGGLALWEIASGRPIRTLPGDKLPVRVLQFATDGSRLLACTYREAALWDLDDPLFWQAPVVSRGKATIPVEELWLDLSATDAASAYRAISVLAQMPAAAIPHLRQHLQPATARDLLKEAIADLDSDAFQTRERAYQTLQRRLTEAEPVLRHVLQKSSSAEVKSRIKMLLAELQKAPSPPRLPGELFGDTLRTVRAIHVLEKIGTREARALLASLADGSSAATETVHARGALQRLQGNR